MSAAVRAGALYAAVLFAIGFALALVRIPVLVPRIGETAAVLVELPVMLTAAWLTARTLTARIPLGPGQRLAMGAVYLPLLLLFELLLGLALGGTARAIIGGWFAMPGALGLGAQALAALFPRLQPAR